MKTAFIILNYKSFEETIRLTRYLLDGGIGDRMILIVDNASPNESFEILSSSFQNEEKVEVISSPKNEGYAIGNNFGLCYLKKYNPHYVCIINNDVYFDISLIQKLEVLYTSIRNVAFLVPMQYQLDNQPVPFLNLKTIPTFIDDLKVTFGLSYLKHVYHVDIEKYKLQEVEIVPGAFLFIDYSLFEELGFFYEGTFLFCEERFIGKKVKDANLHSYIVLDEHYIHAHSVTINSEASKNKQRKLLLDGKVLYTKCYRKFPSLKVWLLYLAYYASMPLRSIIYKYRRLHSHNH